MCGRYYIEDEDALPELRRIIDEINRKYGGGEESVKTGEIFPTNIAPVQVASGNCMETDAMRWGFPRRQGGGVVINARSETAAQSMMFRQPLMERRAIIPTTGFYEWKHEEGKKHKDKYLFRKDGGRMLYLAGLFSFFALEDGLKEARFTILTTAANDSMSPYHDRMPIIIDAEEREEWLLEKDQAAYFLTRPPPALIAEAVRVNTAALVSEQLSFDIT